jgi:hypothetical protein
MAVVLVVLALLGRSEPMAVAELHEPDGSSTSVVVDAATPVVIGGGASADAVVRGLARAARPVPLPVGDDEAAVAVAVATALLLGGWVLLRGDGWGARPVAASPLAARRGPPA